MAWKWRPRVWCSDFMVIRVFGAIPSTSMGVSQLTVSITFQHSSMVRMPHATCSSSDSKKQRCSECKAGTSTVGRLGRLHLPVDPSTFHSWEDVGSESLQEILQERLFHPERFLGSDSLGFSVSQLIAPAAFSAFTAAPAACTLRGW